jgi:hypothetical protein
LCAVPCVGLASFFENRHADPLELWHTLMAAFIGIRCLDCLPQVATETRSSPAMNLEPGHTDPAPRPKGFVRRNWVALLLMPSFLLLSVLNAFLAVHPGFAIFARDGEILVGVASWESFELQPARVIAARVQWSKAHWGTWVRWISSPLEKILVVPIWLPLSFVPVWVAFREWRRKRAANGAE